jgi:hypothetical protein
LEPPRRRPENIPFAVFWKPRDWHGDPKFAKARASNPARPPIRKVIRNQLGHELSSERFSSIRAGARDQARKLYELLSDTVRSDASGYVKNNDIEAAAGACKTWVKSQHLGKWEEAIRVLEKNHEELRLCSDSWKADHLLGQALLAVNKKERKNARKAAKAAATTADTDTETDVEPPNADAALDSPISRSSLGKRKANDISHTGAGPSNGGPGLGELVPPSILSSPHWFSTGFALDPTLPNGTNAKDEATSSQSQSKRQKTGPSNERPETPFLPSPSRTQESMLPLTDPSPQPSTDLPPSTSPTLSNQMISMLGGGPEEFMGQFV